MVFKKIILLLFLILLFSGIVKANDEELFILPIVGDEESYFIEVVGDEELQVYFVYEEEVIPFEAPGGTGGGGGGPIILGDLCGKLYEFIINHTINGVFEYTFDDLQAISSSVGAGTYFTQQYIDNFDTRCFNISNRTISFESPSRNFSFFEIIPDEFEEKSVYPFLIVAGICIACLTLFILREIRKRKERMYLR